MSDQMMSRMGGRSTLAEARWLVRFGLALVSLQVHAQASVPCTPPACWPGKFYKFEVMAQAPSTLSYSTPVYLAGFGNQPSINEHGMVAFVGQTSSAPASGADSSDGVFMNNGTGVPTYVTSAASFFNAKRSFDSAVQINSANQIVARDTIPGSPPPSYVRIWDGNNPGSETDIAEGNATGQFATVLTQPAINISNETAFTAYDQNFNNLLATPISGEPSVFNEATLTSLPVRPLIDDQGGVVTRQGNADNAPIVRYEYNMLFFSTIADTTNQFIAVGQSPGVSRDGTLVAFFGYLSQAGSIKWNTNPGPGIFLAMLGPAGTLAQIYRISGFTTAVGVNPCAPGTGGVGTDVLGSKCVEDTHTYVDNYGTPDETNNGDGYCDPGEACVADGELEGGGAAPIYFLTFDQNSYSNYTADWNQRVGVIRTDYGSTSTAVVSFVATPSASSSFNTFTGNASGLWTVQVDLVPSGLTIQAKVHRPIPVLQVGDYLGTSAMQVAQLSVYDPVASSSYDESGNARIPSPGDHQVALWVSTNTNSQLILRGIHNDTDGDGLLDHWETYGIDFDGNGTIDLNLSSLDPANPPNPLHKDLYVEADYMSNSAAQAANCGVAGNNAGICSNLVHTHHPLQNPYTGDNLAVPFDPITSVKSAFAAAPVDNPDGATGVDLHVQIDESIPEVTPVVWEPPASQVGALRPLVASQQLKWGTLISIADLCSPGTIGHLGTAVERASSNCQNILGARALFVRYALFGHAFSDASAPVQPLDRSGISDLPGPSFMVTFDLVPVSNTPCQSNGWADTSTCQSITWLTAFDTEWGDLIAGTFMHELGHTLGLYHGGTDPQNNKPNYLSVMNYLFQTNDDGLLSATMPNANCAIGAIGTIVCTLPPATPPASGCALNNANQWICRTNRTLNYSVQALPDLDETALIDSNGILGPAGQLFTLWYPTTQNCQAVIGPSTGPLDWLFTGQVAPKSVAVALHEQYQQFANNMDQCPAGVQQITLHGAEDWSGLRYRLYDTTDIAPGSPPASLSPLPPEFNAVDYAATVGLNLTSVAPVVTSSAPVVTTQPLNVNVAVGSTATFAATASGTPTPTVQWQYSSNAGSTYQHVASATSGTLSFVPTAAQNGDLYQAVFTNSAGTATSSPARLTVTQPQVQVPSVVGDAQSAAIGAITGAGLDLGTVTTASSNTVPAGSVISQSPTAGTSVAGGSTVRLVVSSGPAQVSVPGVVGLTQAAATGSITGAGLKLGSVGSANSSTVPSGSVISQSPAAGTSVTSGSSINITVSTGPASLTVPDVVGDTQVTAGAAITGAGLTVGTIAPAVSSTVPSGSVISENPGAGTSVASGSPVSLLISSGPASVTIVIGGAPAIAAGGPGWNVTVLLENTGTATAQLQMTSATLGGVAALNAPPAITLAPRATGSLVLSFPSSAGAGGAAVALSVGGSYSANSLAGNWTVGGRARLP